MTSSPPQEKVFIWPPFFEYNKRLLRQKTGGACLYMHQDGHWLASFEVIPPPKKVSFPAAKKMKILHWKLFSWSNFFFWKFWRFTVFAAKILSRRSRLSRWSRAPSRLIRPRPIDWDRGPKQRVKIFPVLGFELCQKKVFFKRSKV